MSGDNSGVNVWCELVFFPNAMDLDRMTGVSCGASCQETKLIIFQDSCRSRITIEDIVIAKVSITVSRARGLSIGTIVITGESIHRDVDVLPV